MLAVVVVAEGSPLINRCRSSASSASESSPSSKASSKSLSGPSCIGSSWRRRRDDGEDDREWKEGGGETGIGAVKFGTSGKASSCSSSLSSWVLTYIFKAD